MKDRAAPFPRRSSYFVSREQERALLEEYKKTGSEDALLSLMKLHYPFCRKKAVSYARRPNMDLFFEDIEQEAVCGLIRGAQEFDLNRKTRFLTFAGHWMQHYLERFFCRNVTTHTRSVNIDPNNDLDDHKKMKKVMALWERYHGLREPTSDEKKELEKELGFPYERVDELTAQYFSVASSLNAPLTHDDDGNVTRMDMLEDEERPDALSCLSRASEAAYLRNLFNKTDLNPVERQIIEARYLTSDDDNKPVRPEIIGKRMGLSRSRVSQIEQSALEKLRAAAERDRLGAEEKLAAIESIHNRGQGRAAKPPANNL